MANFVVNSQGVQGQQNGYGLGLDGVNRLGNLFGDGSAIGLSVNGRSAGGGGGGAPSFAQLSTLNPQQQRLADLLEKNIGTGASGSSLYGKQAGDMGSALQNALTSNPSSSLSPQATAQYMNAAVATPLLRQYDETIMPRLKDAYAAVGALMSSRRGLAQQKALEQLQTTLASELGKAQLSNQQQSAQLSEQMAQRQAGTVNQQQQNQLGYNQLAAGLTGQSWMAIQPYINGGSNNGGQGSFNSNPLGNALNQARMNSSGGNVVGGYFPPVGGSTQSGTYQIPGYNQSADTGFYDLQSKFANQAQRGQLA